MAGFRSTRLADGSRVQVVPIRPQDRARLRRDLVEAFPRLSEESRFTRFLSPVPHLTEGHLRRLVDTVDDRDHVALVLELVDAGTPIGLARFLRDPTAPTSAELAVTVADEWQGKGAGTILAGALLEAARKRGVDQLTALVLADNRGALAMLRSCGRLTRIERSGATVEVTVEV